jgi:hypothetical protein
MRGWAIAVLSVVTVAWVLFAWISLGYFLLVQFEDYTHADAAIAVATFVAVPVALILGWSLALQRRLPTSRQVVRGALGCGALLCVLGAIVAVGFGIGWLFDNTALDPTDFGF